MGYSSSYSLEQQSTKERRHHSSCGLTSTPKLSNMSAVKTETSFADASARSSSSREEADRSGEFSVSNASDAETEWVEQNEPGIARWCTGASTCFVQIIKKQHCSRV